MIVNQYALLTRCVEDGIECGWRRAHKHFENPDPETIRNAIHDAVLNAISEYFVFPEVYS